MNATIFKNGSVSYIEFHYTEQNPTLVAGMPAANGVFVTVKVKISKGKISIYSKSRYTSNCPKFSRAGRVINIDDALLAAAETMARKAAEAEAFASLLD